MQLLKDFIIFSFKNFTIMNSEVSWVQAIIIYSNNLFNKQCDNV